MSDSHDWAGILERAERRLVAEPDDVDASRSRAQAIGAMGDLERAHALMEDHLRRHPADSHAWNLQSAYLLLSGRFEAGIQAADEALRRDPRLLIAHYNRACACALLGRVDDALASLEIAIDCDADLREHARVDEAFLGLSDHSRFRALLD